MRVNCFDHLVDKMFFMLGRITMTGDFEVNLHEKSNMIATPQLLKLMSDVRITRDPVEYLHYCIVRKTSTIKVVYPLFDAPEKRMADWRWFRKNSFNDTAHELNGRICYLLACIHVLTHHL